MDDIADGHFVWFLCNNIFLKIAFTSLIWKCRLKLLSINETVSVNNVLGSYQALITKNGHLFYTNKFNTFKHDQLININFSRNGIS